MQTINQSGNKETFDTGAQRDSQAGKSRPDLISPYALERVGWIMKQGGDHYGDRNWEKGMKFSRMMASLERHRVAYLQGKTDEDHLAQMVWNGLGLLHFEAMVRLGLLPADLNDLPAYEQVAGTKNLCAPCRPSPRYDATDWSARDHAYFQAAVDRCSISTPTRFGTLRPVRSPKFYVAGPMRGLPNYNFPAFDTAVQVGKDAGYDVISPADMDRDSGFHETDSMDKAATMTKEFCRRDTNALLSLDASMGDGIALLPGWEKSTGALAEFFLARWLGLRVVDARTFEPLSRDACDMVELYRIVDAVTSTMSRKL